MLLVFVLNSMRNFSHSNECCVMSIARMCAVAFSSVQFSGSVVSDSLRPHESQHARPPCPSPTPGVHSDSRPSSQWCNPAISSSVVPFSSCPQSLPASDFSNESTLHLRWPKYWSFSFSIIPSKEIPGLISFRMDWLDLLAVQGTLKSLLQHHSSKASVLCSAFFTVQLSHPYMTTGKTIALTRRTFVGKVMGRFIQITFPDGRSISCILIYQPQLLWHRNTQISVVWSNVYYWEQTLYLPVYWTKWRMLVC